ncbi:30S ribosomal protein S12 methylthiotransferase RimO [Planctomycetota bacterium]
MTEIEVNELSNSGTVAFVSLGCPKNQVDAEVMLGALVEDGFCLSADPTIADIIIVNTCSFIESARQESVSQIKEMAQFKRNHRCRALVVAGCMAQQDGEMLMAEVPEIDALLGVSKIQELPALCRDLMVRQDGGEKITVVSDPDDMVMTNAARLRIGLPHYAYLKISEGCDHKCSFCTIPMIRGRLKSRSIEDMVFTSRQLVDTGAKELIIVGQDSTSYGQDIYNQRRLPELCREITRIKELEWLRILYQYPTNYPMELIDEIVDNDKIVNYIDLPLQHINDEILTRMKRGWKRSEIEKLLATMREKIPNLVLRTTMLVGFPGESEEQFRELYEFVEEFEFERLGVFVYSFEKETQSATMAGRLTEKVKRERFNALMELQQNIAFEANRNKVGTSVRVLVDGYDEVGEHYIGRTYGDAPDIDNQVYFTASPNGELPEIGKFYNVKVLRSLGYDLAGHQQPEFSGVT